MLDLEIEICLVLFICWKEIVIIQIKLLIHILLLILATKMT